MLKTKRMQILEQQWGQPIEVIIGHRMFRGLSDVQIAQELGLDNTTVYKYRRRLGLRRPRDKVAMGGDDV